MSSTLPGTVCATWSNKEQPPVALECQVNSKLSCERLLRSDRFERYVLLRHFKYSHC